MAAQRFACPLALVAAVSAVAWVSLPSSEVRAAGGSDPFLDSDGDLLPDSLEWVTFANPTATDSDQDGNDDFLEVLQHTAPFASTQPRPFDNEYRLLLSAAHGATDDDGDVWLHCMFRFATGVPTVDWFLPHIHTHGISVPIGDLFGRTPFRLAARPAPGGGSYVVLTMFLARMQDFAPMLPCTVSARASIGGRQFSTGTYVMEIGGAPTALMPAGFDSGQSTFMLQTLAPEPASSSFFSRNKVCELGLAVIGSTSGGHICEVDRAACEPANGLRCNTSCDQTVGAMVFVPDGLGTITGG